MIPFSKRFVASSLLLLISVFFPWFEINVLITKISLHGYNLGFLGVVFIVLSLIGIVASTVQLPRFRGLVESIIGALSLLLMIIANEEFHARLVHEMNNMFGSQGGDTAKVANMIGNTTFGFYVVLIAGFALLVFGLHAIVIHKSEPIMPRSWRSLFSKENIEHVNFSVAEVATTAETIGSRTGSKALQSQWIQSLRLRTRTGKIIGSIVGVLAAYGVAVWIFDSVETSTRALNSFENAVKAGNTNKVAGMLEENKTMSSCAVPGFVKYYQTRSEQLKELLAPIEKPELNEFGSMFSTSQNPPKIIKRSLLGFNQYKIHLPEVELQLSGPRGVKFQADGKFIPAKAWVLPAQYSVTGIVKSPLGTVRDTHTEDATNDTTVQDEFGFQNDMIEVDMQGIPDGKQTLQLNGHKISADFSSEQATIGPIPVKNGQTISVTLNEPFGPFVETGQIQDGQCQLQGDPKANAQLAQTLANVINAYVKQDVSDTNSGNYNPELKYLVPNGPLYQDVQGNVGSQQEKYLGMVASPVLNLTTISDENNEVGVQINDSESYNEYGVTEDDWTYTMVYDPGNRAWKIYSQDINGDSYSPGNGNISLK